jgi:hypothetical protein
VRGYARWLFGFAAAFNLAVGVALLFLRPMLLGRLGFDPVTGSNIVIANLVGMFVALFGYCYLLVAIDPVKYRAYISLGAIGKLLAIMCAVVPWLTGAVAMKPPPLLAGDFVFALLFIDYLRRMRVPSPPI